MPERFNHHAAMAAAIGLRNALRRYRRRLQVSSVLAPAAERMEIERAVDDLRRREDSLEVFLENPYAKNSLSGMSHDDRSVLAAAGRTASTAEYRMA